MLVTRSESPVRPSSRNHQRNMGQQWLAWMCCFAIQHAMHAWSPHAAGYSCFDRQKSMEYRLTCSIAPWCASSALCTALASRYGIGALIHNNKKPETRTHATLNFLPDLMDAGGVLKCLHGNVHASAGIPCSSALPASPFAHICVSSSHCWLLLYFCMVNCCMGETGP
jgi:hypothetical protein